GPSFARPAPLPFAAFSAFLRVRRVPPVLPRRPTFLRVFPPAQGSRSPSLCQCLPRPCLQPLQTDPPVLLARHLSGEPPRGLPQRLRIRSPRPRRHPRQQLPQESPVPVREVIRVR